MNYTQNDIEKVINQFKSLSNPEDRYSSYDYCYNYFHLTKDLTKDMEKSCLVLGFYLASWGMYRGSSFMLQTSAKYLQSVVEYISSLDKHDIWKIDVDEYTDNNIQNILDVYKEIKLKILKGEEHRDIVLVTKIMLGVFGCIPAYDDYFTKTFKEVSKDGKFSTVNKKSLQVIKAFYDDNKSIIDKLQQGTYTNNFMTGDKSNIHYTKSKIVDMYGFQKSLPKSKQSF